MDLREVRDDDSAALIELIDICWGEYEGTVLDVDGEEPWLRAPASSYADSGGAFWVVDGDGRMDACIGWKPVADEVVELKSLYVHPKARRRGLGARLVDQVEMAAAMHGAHTIQLWSDTRFTDAHRLYERLGYQRTGHTRDLHDKSNTTEYEFTKQL